MTCSGNLLTIFLKRRFNLSTVNRTDKHAEFSNHEKDFSIGDSALAWGSKRVKDMIKI